jgi:hypothetical protein
MSRKVGRPLAYEDPKEMEKKIEEYFQECDEREVEEITKKGEVVSVRKQRPYTVSGLCLHLGMDRVTLLEYQKKEEFSNTITRAKLRIENDTEEGMVDSRYDSRGAQFSLRNNFSDIWKEKQEVEKTGTTVLKIVHSVPRPPEIEENGSS